ncbi:MAG TPA: hypothetical protein VHN99_03760 [Deinococcales bacterium]|nr:hypothetical protein [Deinococcales bacterium]
MSTPTPFDSPGAWNTFVLVGPTGRHVLPGRVAVTPRVGLQEDTVSVPGQDGVTTTHLGYQAAEVTVDVQVWTVEQYRALARVLGIIRPRKGAQPVAYDCVHPMLDTLGIRSVYLTTGELPPYTPQGGLTASLTFKEWWAVKSGSPAKPKATPKPKTTKTTTKPKAVTGGKGTGDAAPASPAQQSAALDKALGVTPPSSTLPKPKG